MTTMPLKNFYNDQISYITRFVESVDNENFALVHDLKLTNNCNYNWV